MIVQKLLEKEKEIVVVQKLFEIRNESSHEVARDDKQNLRKNGNHKAQFVRHSAYPNDSCFAICKTT